MSSSKAKRARSDQSLSELDVLRESFSKVPNSDKYGNFHKVHCNACKDAYNQTDSQGSDEAQPTLARYIDHKESYRADLKACTNGTSLGLGRAPISTSGTSASHIFLSREPRPCRSQKLTPHIE